MRAIDPLAPIRDRNPPETLYHYTTPDSVLGILESNEVWATSIHYLNDSREFQEARQVASSHFRRLAEASDHPQANDIATILAESLERISRVNVCVFSVSEVGNLLSQWRAYCPAGGYSLGFDTDQLRQAAQSLGFDLVPCLYTAPEHRSLVDPVAEAAFHRFVAEIEADPAGLAEVLERVIDTLFPEFWRVAPAVKHSAFSEEREWRLVSPPMADSALSHRTRGPTLVPYCRLPLFDHSDARVALNDTVVGPSAHPELANDAFGTLLTRTGAPWKAYRPSHIPFRDL